MKNIEKICIGALGGLSAVLVKFLGQDYDNVVTHVANLTSDELLAYKIGYGLLTPILMFLGGFIAWISDEEKRMKIAAIAIAAPAMITTWSGGAKPDDATVMNYFVSSSYAQSSAPQMYPDEPDSYKEYKEKSEKSTINKIRDGVGIFFGYGKEPKKYWVIVGSYKDKDAAQHFANKVNAEDKSLQAWVGVKAPPNEYFPVIVGEYSPFSEAQKLKQKALATESVQDAYLSRDLKK